MLEDPEDVFSELGKYFFECSVKKGKLQLDRVVHNYTILQLNSNKKFTPIDDVTLQFVKSVAEKM